MSPPQAAQTLLKRGISSSLASQFHPRLRPISSSSGCANPCQPYAAKRCRRLLDGVDGVGRRAEVAERTERQVEADALRHLPGVQVARLRVRHQIGEAGIII